MTQDPGSDDRRLAGPSQVPADDYRAWMPPGSSSGPPSYGEPSYPGPAYPGSPYPAPAGYPGSAPPAGYPYLPPPPLPPILPRGIPRLRPVRIDSVPGTPYGIAIPALNPTFSGLAVGSMVAGIGSILVSLAVLCAGISQASAVCSRSR